MYINDKHISEFGARLLNYLVSGSAVTSQYLKSVKGTSLSLFNQEFGVKKLTVNLDIRAKDRNEVTSKVAMLVSNLVGKVEITLPDGYMYTSILMEVADPVHIMDTLFTVSFSFDCIQHLPLEIVELTNAGVIDVKGTLDTNCIIEILSTTTIANYKINGINIFPLTANRAFVIDGIAGKVTDNGVNSILKTDLIDFPKVKPGENTISMSHPVTVTIKYYPTFM